MSRSLDRSTAGLIAVFTGLVSACDVVEVVNAPRLIDFAVTTEPVPGQVVHYRVDGRFASASIVQGASVVDFVSGTAFSDVGNDPEVDLFAVEESLLGSFTATSAEMPVVWADGFRAEDRLTRTARFDPAICAPDGRFEGTLSRTAEVGDARCLFDAPEMDAPGVWRVGAGGEMVDTSTRSFTGVVDADACVGRYKSTSPSGRTTWTQSIHFGDRLEIEMSLISIMGDQGLPFECVIEWRGFADPVE